MSTRAGSGPQEPTIAEPVGHATAPARWLLESGANGVPLTQTHALARVVVREAAERWPDWWEAELFGPPHREADVRVLGALHDGLRRLRLMRRRGRRLLTTARGRSLAGAPQALLVTLATDLGGGDPFGDLVAATTMRALSGSARTHDALALVALRQAVRGGWVDPAGNPPTLRDLSWAVSDVLCRGEAYGLIVRRREPGRSRWSPGAIALSDAGRTMFAPDRGGSQTMSVLVFDAEVTNVRGVRARLAVPTDDHLTALHDAIQEAFGWYDDHLYSFWLDGRFWGDDAHEFTSPVTPDEAAHTADVSLAELDLAVGQRIAYVFDFGDEWRVKLTVREYAESDAGPYPRVLQRKGTAPPQYD